jgi:hypothetical protein
MTVNRRLTNVGASVFLAVMLTGMTLGSTARAQTVSDWDAAYADLVKKGQAIIDTVGIAAFDATFQTEYTADLDALDGVGAAAGGDLAVAIPAATKAMRDGMTALADDLGASLTAAYEALALVDTQVQAALGAAPSPSSTGNAGLLVEHGGTSLWQIMSLVLLALATVGGARLVNARMRPA